VKVTEVKQSRGNVSERVIQAGGSVWRICRWPKSQPNAGGRTLAIYRDGCFVGGARTVNQAIIFVGLAVRANYADR
jgi:hypothetical protein